jgi:hypothetical protein
VHGSGAIETGEIQHRDIAACEHRGAGGKRILSLQVAGDQAAPAAPGTTADDDRGFQNTSTVTLP